MTDVQLTGEAHARTRGSRIRVGVLAYAVFAYAAFVASTVWAVGFLADWKIAKAVDGRARQPAWIALFVDVSLLMIFAIQHTVMARVRFKRLFTRVFPVGAERSTYVLAASLALILLFLEWQPVPATVWRLDAQAWTAVVWTLYGIGWVIAVSATFMVDHSDFLGLRQARAHARRDPYEPPPFVAKWFYAWVRHPMMLGLLIAFWATPRMSVGHLVFATGATAYIAVGIRFEERELRRQYRDVYRDYTDRVPAVLPVIGRAARHRG